MAYARDELHKRTTVLERRRQSFCGYHSTLWIAVIDVHRPRLAVCFQMFNKCSFFVLSL